MCTITSGVPIWTSQWIYNSYRQGSALYTHGSTLYTHASTTIWHASGAPGMWIPMNTNIETKGKGQRKGSLGNIKQSMLAKQQTLLTDNKNTFLPWEWCGEDLWGMVWATPHRPRHKATMSGVDLWLKSALQLIACSFRLQSFLPWRPRTKVWWTGPYSSIFYQKVTREWSSCHWEHTWLAF